MRRLGAKNAIYEAAKSFFHLLKGRVHVIGQAPASYRSSRAVPKQPHMRIEALAVILSPRCSGRAPVEAPATPR